MPAVAPDAKADSKPKLSKRPAICPLGGRAAFLESAGGTDPALSRDPQGPLLRSGRPGRAAAYVPGHPRARAEHCHASLKFPQRAFTAHGLIVEREASDGCRVTFR